MNNNDYKNLVDFWNQTFLLTEDSKKEIFADINPDTDYKELSPSIKQLEALEGFSKCHNVLDYGAGTGWASIMMAKAGAKKVVATDVAKNSIEMINQYKKAFKVEDKIESIHIDENWLKNQIEGGYDGFFSSNVIDVVPLDMAKEIIKASRKVVKENARVVYSLNFYIDPKLMEARGATINGPHVYLNSVLRLTSLKDEEWIDIFKEYYEVESLIYYAWPGEEKETRRLFVLKPR